MGESIEIFVKSAGDIDRKYDSLPQDIRSALGNVLGFKGAADFVESHKVELMNGTIPVLFLRSAIHLLLVSIMSDSLECSAVK